MGCLVDVDELSFEYKGFVIEKLFQRLFLIGTAGAMVGS